VDSILISPLSCPASFLTEFYVAARIYFFLGKAASVRLHSDFAYAESPADLFIEQTANRHHLLHTICECRITNLFPIHADGSMDASRRQRTEAPRKNHF